MTKINATVVAHSINPQGDELISILATFPRIILSEVNTHRMLSKNTSSSRAIPFNKMVEAIEKDPFIPIAWQKHHSGMQGSEYLTDENIINFKKGVWLKARDEAIKRAEELNGDLIRWRGFETIEETIHDTGVTKQLCNRLLEPFMWTTMLITGSKEGWDNFFDLRCPSYEIDVPSSSDRGSDWTTLKFKSRKDLQKEIYSDEIDNYSDLDWLKVNKGQAEIHMMALAEAIYDAMNESTPKPLKEGEWHIPFGDKIVEDDLLPILYKVNAAPGEMAFQKVKIASARCARLSYMTFDGKIDYEKDLKLHDTLLESHHMSPFEHCARAMNNEEYETHYKGILSKGLDYYHPQEEDMGWCRNFKGFIQYRHLIENGNR